MKVLVACEESQAVCNAFRALGHEAYSCDIIPCSGGHPEWHIQDEAHGHMDKPSRSPVQASVPLRWPLPCASPKRGENRHTGVAE